jgi:2-keto-4-pentenoate hydratase/2-oxohepta-3-ene-1,7-dioic acid hydratase in catechol pathway
MKLATYTASGQTRTGIVVGDRIIDTGVNGTMIDLIRDWDKLKAGLEAKAKAGGGVALSSVKLEAPVPRPGKIFAIGLNYADHIEGREARAPGVVHEGADQRQRAVRSDPDREDDLYRRL